MENKIPFIKAGPCIPDAHVQHWLVVAVDGNAVVTTYRLEMDLKGKNQIPKTLSAHTLYKVIIYGWKLGQGRSN